MNGTFPLVVFALILAMIAAVAVEIVRKGFPKCPQCG
jgi:hypothetical protein